MNSLLSYVDEHFGKRIILAIVLAVVFSVAPKLLSDTYYRYFDKTQYLTIVQPVSVDKKSYKPCEDTVLTATFTATIDVNVDSLTQLILVRDDGVTTRVGMPMTARTPIRAMKQHVVSGAIPLPCDLMEGRYFWQGTGTYQVYGYDRTISFVSDTFNVFKTGISPGTEESIQNQINESTNSAEKAEPKGR